MEFVAVDYHSGHNYGPYIQPTGHISYTLGYYSGSHYNGYLVHGSYGHRYYHAPRGYSHHRHYRSPPRTVVVHQHVHVASCYVRGGHSYTPPRPRHTPVPRSTPPRHTPPRQHDNRNDRRNDRRRQESQPRHQPRQQPRQEPQHQPRQRQEPRQNVRVDRKERRRVKNQHDK